MQFIFFIHYIVEGYHAAEKRYKNLKVLFSNLIKKKMNIKKVEIKRIRKN